ncbi:MAG: hypothetical protein ACI4RT_06040 [Candidatus Spyradenecus sp.]
MFFNHKEHKSEAQAEELCQKEHKETHRGAGHLGLLGEGGDAQPTVKYPKGAAVEDLLNPPRGTQRVYTISYHGKPFSVYVYADSGKVSGWHLKA